MPTQGRDPGGLFVAAIGAQMRDVAVVSEIEDGMDLHGRKTGVKECSATATVLNWSASRGFSLSVDIKGWHQRRYKCVELHNPKKPLRLTHATETALTGVWCSLETAVSSFQPSNFPGPLG